jgi:spermidine/putrescine-binding protein
VALNNDPKNLFLIANEFLFQSANATSTEQIDQAYDYLLDIVRPGNVAVQGDDMLASIVTGEFDVAVMYSGDAVLAVSEYLANNNHQQAFALARPNVDGQGTNVYFDGMVLSKNTVHELAAYRFINFIRDKAVANSQYVGLASPFKAVMDEVSQNNFSDFSA